MLLNSLLTIIIILLFLRWNSKHETKLNWIDSLDLIENLNCLTFMPIVCYNDALSKKKQILSENMGKTGIYRWTHLESNKSYIGSSVNLGKRLKNYFNTTFISHSTRRIMIINKALLKHGYSKFKLEILEYCTTKDLVKREQYYLDRFSPEYNVLKTTYSSIGYKHTNDSLEKVRINLVKLNLSKSIKVKVTNILTNTSVEYDSVREAAKNLNVSKDTLKRYILEVKLLKGIYKLESNLKPSSYESNYVNHPASIGIEVTDLELKTVTRYPSISEAARVLNLKFQSIAIYFRRNQKSPFKGRYVFKKVV